MTDYKEACRLIKADGWATDVKYTDKLVSLIEKYGLTKYDEEVLEVVEKDKIIVNGKECKVNMIRKDGVTYIKTRDLAEVLGLKVSSKGKIPVLIKE